MPDRDSRLVTRETVNGDRNEHVPGVFQISGQPYDDLIDILKFRQRAYELDSQRILHVRRVLGFGRHDFNANERWSSNFFRRRPVRMQLRKIVVLVIGMVLLIAVALGNSQPVLFEKVETRCGWFSNPTPANASLYDAQREWIISVQGGYEAEGDWPDIPEKQWVITNVHYGYGCACMRVTVNRETSKVIKIVSSSARPVSACRRDRALKKWGFK